MQVPTFIPLCVRTGAALLAAAAAGCSYMPSTDRVLASMAPYKIDIVQGNVVTREQIALIKPGMQRTQVRDTLGTPLLTDIFHGERWDYVFTIRRPGTEPQRRAIVVLFEGDRVRSVEAPPDLPSELEFVGTIARNPLPEQPRKLELNAEERKALPPPPPMATQAVVSPQGAVRTYPPLEGS